MKPIRIEVEQAIEEIKAYRLLNAPDLSQIVFFRDGEQVNIPPEVIEEFNYLGLNNTDFIRSFFMGEKFWTNMALIGEKADGSAEAEAQEGRPEV